MKKKSLLALVMIIAVFSAMFFASCGKKEQTLEEYCADNPEIQKSIDEAMSGKNVLVEIKGNDIVYSFDLSKADGYTEEIAKSDEINEALTNALTQAGPTFGGIAKSLEESTKVSGINVTVNYQWGDEVLVTKTFTSADADAAPAEDTKDAAEEAEDAAEDAAEEAEGEGE
ncbi:MAG: DUF4854 domain-containing protein [Mogibacterium sp.]|nr:DUF4854 domain-containing protein [Mogibacterium sp.]